MNKALSKAFVLIVGLVLSHLSFATSPPPPEPSNDGNNSAYEMVMIIGIFTVIALAVADPERTKSTPDNGLSTMLDADKKHSAINRIRINQGLKYDASGNGIVYGLTIKY